MLLLTSSRRASRCVLHALQDAGITASEIDREGLFPISVKTARTGAARALRIARAVDPLVQDR